jgi:hypothetical protein
MRGNQLQRQSQANQLQDKLRFCRCPSPERRVDDGVTYCDRCGDYLGDPLLELLVGKVRALSRRVDRLEALGPGPDPPTYGAAGPGPAARNG